MNQSYIFLLYFIFLYDYLFFEIDRELVVLFNEMDREVIILLYEIGLDNNQILKLQMYPELVEFFIFKEKQLFSNVKIFV